MSEPIGNQNHLMRTWIESRLQEPKIGPALRQTIENIQGYIKAGYPSPKRWGCSKETMQELAGEVTTWRGGEWVHTIILPTGKVELYRRTYDTW